MFFKKGKHSGELAYYVMERQAWRGWTKILADAIGKACLFCIVSVCLMKIQGLRDWPHPGGIIRNGNLVAKTEGNRRIIIGRKRKGLRKESTVSNSGSFPFSCVKFCVSFLLLASADGIVFWEGCAQVYRSFRLMATHSHWLLWAVRDLLREKQTRKENSILKDQSVCSKNESKL